MGVYIKDIKAPESCNQCQFKYRTMEGDECMFDVIQMDYQKRPDDCPLVSVPPHGDLKDTDALIDWLYDDEPSPWKASFRLCTADRSDVKFLLKIAPTIIPASEEGER